MVTHRVLRRAFAGGLSRRQVARRYRVRLALIDRALRGWTDGERRVSGRPR